ncbi:ABC-F family ATP-binding cassette domain-containing protein [Synoicihabitans lomoniglobus]|uniref:ABC-F family ATP-binding cassette domain-containing protein n=1 Tax=Synoicihabitans lomoniglobus TaxID=2909285 RepID=A0AAE9ZR98_9BACT|nr:ABC-F family ATP-binding cassette domain-containing protein [Opitutaceae bacterium LMO-M01]WED63780.1 ABC-F family ATP-binding cassette domain-containing protein [Opitutaceae bacterium LMO-M01]
MLTIADVAKSYGTRELFSDVSLFVARTDRLGLVGPNGAGKSTLFNLILGKESPDNGVIEWERGADFGFLPQESAPVGDETVIAIATDGQKLDFDGDDDDDYDIDWTLEPRARKILAGLGFKDADMDLPAKSFSGGWIMRAHLARLLVSEPTLLLLDEPTNHLDLEALLWFQDYLTRYPGGLVVISHDRAFLNALCNGILELRGATLHKYTGNYDDYLEQKEARHEQLLAVYKNQQREIAHQQKFVDRFGAKASMATRAKSKEKHIARLKEEAVESPEMELKRINFRFPQPPRSGLKVIELEHVEQAYGDHVVYQDLNFTAERGEKIVLVGPNGAGKSTLLKILGDVIPIRGGERELGSNVYPGYFAQNRADNLKLDETVLANVMELRTAENDLTEQQARAILGAFLFRKDDVFKKVSVLSGGEKSRLALARLLVDPPNLLLMDEPTTHLDIQSIDALISALKAFAGTFIFISHDVYFIRQLAETVLHVHGGRLTRYAGDYDYYLEKSQATGEREALTAGFTAARPDQAKSAAKTNAKPDRDAAKNRDAEIRKLRSSVGDLEQKVVDLEAKQGELTAELEDPGTYEEAGKAQHLNRELTAVTDQLTAANREWEAAAERLVELEKA